ncbi:iron complex outermembrane receptor protein [Altererythrobacter atlanticus]|uniref:Vitamin B12 transporter BtuB n=1 Tax=Croceibacterium atlanticum TaxID=1267766 RepID=A0A0F7KPL3_9SPHN|nr:TonB-dependent receptor [Croceibacterium atlanticum]AKH41504.1 Vitamin B12 transporter BtuB precursor [Croceibacterium atlanticum]MBB5732966.1 iron complex outermembrane receptor protein [Croceibacterium atlanticum]
MSRTAISKQSAKLLRTGSASAMAAASMVMFQPAMAQDNAEEETGTRNTIIVTGSRVSMGEAPVGATATVLGRDEIVESGAVTIDRVIKELPQNFDLGVSENSRGQAGGSGNITYGNSVNLRGIGPYATLVLIDGHRVVNNSRSTDPSVLPTLGVERVEIVANGASAIYGSDAVAGVVNLIPRRNLDGVEAFARYGFAEDGAFDEWSAGAAIGKTFSRGQVMVAFEHVERSNLSGDDRDFFVSDQRPFGGEDYRTARCAPGTLVIDGVNYALPAEYTQANADAITAGTANLCDNLTGQDLFPEQKYNSVNATGSFEITDWAELFVDGFYSKRKFRRLSAQPSARLTVPETNAFFVRPSGFTGSSYQIDYSFENEIPLTGTNGYAESWQISPGVRFQLPFGWELEALAAYGETHDFSGAYDGVNNAALNAALASSDPSAAFDPYGLGRTQQGVIDGIFNQIFLAPTDGQLTFYEAGASGPLFDLPGGEVRMAAGYERQEFDVDLGVARGAPDTPMSFRSFDRSVDSVYAELLLPIFGPGNAMPGFQALELTAAVRHDSYSDAGKTTNPQFGVNWTPVEGVKLRGSYGTSFRAPTIPEIYGNGSNLYVQNYQNPQGGAPIIGVAYGSGPNLDLGPETATTWSVGADLEPTENLRLSITYFDVEYDDQIAGNLSNLTILGQEDQYAGTGVILRGTAARDRVAELIADGKRVLGVLPGGSVDNVTLFIDGRSLNLGKSITRGIDFNVGYFMDLGPNDSLTLNASGTYLTEYKVSVAPAAPVLDQLNIIFQPLRFKARASVSWDHGPLTARVLATHVGGYKNNLVTPVEDVESFTPVDLTLTWRVGETFDGSLMEGLELIGEVRNLFDADPPYVNLAPNGNGSGGYDATAANPVGRQFAIGARIRF